MNQLDDTFLQICIDYTSYFPANDTKKIIEKLLEKGADITYNPKAHYPIPFCHEEFLWSAALNGNVGAYSAIINHSQKDHLLRLYEDKILKLPRVITFALKYLEAMEDCCRSDENDRPLKKVKWHKIQLQKIQDINTKYYPEKDFTLSDSMLEDEKSLITKFLKERIPDFDKYINMQK